MRIGLLLPTIFSSRKFGEGRIFAPGELAISLADNLVARGHEVTMYSSRDVVTKANVVPGDENLTDRELTYYQFRYREEAERKFSEAEIVKRDFEYDLTARAYQDAREGRLDIIHSYHDFGAHYFNELTGFPTVYTLHDPLPQTDNTIEWHRFKRFVRHHYISISDSQRESPLALNFAATIYHGLDLADFPFFDRPGEYLIHFGRVLEDKGTDQAIQASLQSGLPLKLATSTIRANKSGVFYDTKVAPLVDGQKVVQVGFLSGREKAEYIGGGRVFLLPLRWEEPFGMVMIEAMACGVPVVAYNRGSAAEIVEDGVTGFIVDPPVEDEGELSGRVRQAIGSHIVKKRGVEGLVEAVNRIGEISRAACRKRVEGKFSVERMVMGYEGVYEKVVGSR